MFRLTTKISDCLAILFMTLFLLAPVAANHAAAAEAPGRIAFLPFKSNGPKDMTYLTNGIRDMLGSRLASEVGLTIIDRATVDQTLPSPAQLKNVDDYRQAGKQLQADYLVIGSLTAFGSSLSIDSKVFNVAQGSLQSFYATAKNEDEIILAIDKLAWDISEKVFSHPRPATALVQPATAPTQNSQATNPYMSAHPDRTLAGRNGFYGASPFITPKGATSGFTKSQNMRMSLQYIEKADLNGDGVDEIIMADRKSVQIFSRDGNRFAKVGQVTVANRLRIHAVSIGDLNGNHKPEVYVSAADYNAPNSFAFEWIEKDQVNYLVEDAPFYLRTMDIPGEGKVLLGQRADIDYPVSPGIYRLALAGNNLAQESRFEMPAKVNLFDFAVADLDGDKINEIIAIDQYDRLQVMHAAGSILWKSDDYYGGSTRFIGGRDGLGLAAELDADKDLNRVYIPSRIIVRDLNHDGLPDILINKNLSSASRVFKNMKSYPAGEIHALTWNGIALAELWRTQKIDGYIVDYLLSPNPDNTKAELLVGIILPGSSLSFLEEQNCTVLMYQLNLAKAENTEPTN
ncbi:MAG: FG-GAP-like repeat-containing protein [Desulfobulbaceae bacterium]|nr:FG-GAP-like repeat-containing protein [Desulfobulbaceae bacterium]HIJ79767.1 VCBS repeat-containing protein [Deltaproteobacteria bacterium]